GPIGSEKTHRLKRGGERTPDSKKVVPQKSEFLSEFPGGVLGRTVHSIRELDQGMLTQILTYLRQMEHRIETVLAEFLGGSNPRQHQQFRSVDRACAQDYAPRLDTLRNTCAFINHAKHSGAANPQPLYLSVSDQLRVFLPQNRLQKRISGAASEPPMLRQLGIGNTFLTCSVIILVHRDTEPNSGLHERARQRVDLPNRANM